ncbi:hypothetical protein, partial [Burkholderia gladioli]|uniref:hypothetical protein n=1 Tax=Burkholderia gladioli TaxID=28095 RepID=UPI003F791CE2
AAPVAAARRGAAGFAGLASWSLPVHAVIDIGEQARCRLPAPGTPGIGAGACRPRRFRNPAEIARLVIFPRAAAQGR